IQGSEACTLRVLHRFKAYMPESTGGIERTVVQLCDACKPGRGPGRVLTLRAEPAPNPNKAGNHLVYQATLDAHIASTGLSREVFGRFRELAREHDVVHYHFPWPLMDLLHLHARHDKPSVLSYHSDIVRQRLLLQFYRPLMH